MKTFLSVLGLILILIFFFYQNQTKKEGVEILQGLKGRTIGVVTYAKGTRFEMEYKLENQTQILRRTRPYVGIQEGESFMLAYDLGDGSKIIPIFSEPQINDSLFNTTHTIEPLSWDFSNLYDDKKAIEFYYKVGGKEFSKYQILGFNINKEDIELEKKYKVKYHKENPKIAYVIFDQVLFQLAKSSKTPVQEFSKASLVPKTSSKGDHQKSSRLRKIKEEQSVFQQVAGFEPVIC